MSTETPSSAFSSSTANRYGSSWKAVVDWLRRYGRPSRLPPIALTTILAGIVGLLGGYGAIVFLMIIETVQGLTVGQVLGAASETPSWMLVLCLVPAGGLLVVGWLTTRFAPEAEGHGVPEVITAIARHDGAIRPRVSLIKILASGICIGTGGSVGREGPIVQIGSSLGSSAGQWFGLSPRHVKVLVAAGAAAGISATFNAPIAGVIFASEIILGSFAVESLTPIVLASVLADVVQQHHGEHGLSAAFPQLEYGFKGAWEQLPSYIVLGLLCGLLAVSFTKLLYFVEDIGKQWLPKWWLRALVFGGLAGMIAVGLGSRPPVESVAARQQVAELGHDPPPALFGVGYRTVDHVLHLTLASKPGKQPAAGAVEGTSNAHLVQGDKIVPLSPNEVLAELWWLLPLALFKPLLTSLSLGGGGSGGIFAPSLFIGATSGAVVGFLCNMIVPAWSASPGAYAIVGMGAVVAGTTHGILSAVLIVYEMTDNYEIILPIMVAAGISSAVAQLVDSADIYNKKLIRRGEQLARGHDMHCMEHIMVRDVMVRDFPAVRNTHTAEEIIRVARANSNFDSLPVLDENDSLVGVIRPESLNRVLDTDVTLRLINAHDIAIKSPISVPPHANLLEALRDFGTRDVEVLPVQINDGKKRRLVGILRRADVMRRYRMELLQRHS